MMHGQKNIKKPNFISNRTVITDTWHETCTFIVLYCHLQKVRC